MKVVLIKSNEVNRENVDVIEDWFLPADAVDTGKVNEAGFKIYTLVPETAVEEEEEVEDTSVADATAALVASDAADAAALVVANAAKKHKKKKK
jgi:hypothetical protein